MTTKAKTSPEVKAILRDKAATNRVRNAIDNNGRVIVQIGDKTYRVSSLRMQSHSPKTIVKKAVHKNGKLAKVT